MKKVFLSRENFEHVIVLPGNISSEIIAYLLYLLIFWNEIPPENAWSSMAMSHTYWVLIQSGKQVGVVILTSCPIITCIPSLHRFRETSRWRQFNILCHFYIVSSHPTREASRWHQFNAMSYNYLLIFQTIREISWWCQCNILYHF